MKVVGLYLVRNEVDVIETNLRHHFSRAIDEAILLDNGSTDGTFELLAELTKELPIQLASEPGSMYQAQRSTRMARYATEQGADWLLPIDADEFWVGSGASFREVLEHTPDDVRALFVEVVNFVQSREVLVARPGCLASMTMRPERGIGPAEETSRMVRGGEIGWLEAAYTPKCVLRASPDVVVAKGNHVTGIEGGMPTGLLTCLHAPIRARSRLAAKLDHGRRLIEDGSPPEAGWHVKRWWMMARAGALGTEWDALSYQDGAITVAEHRRHLVPDHRLRDAAVAVAPEVRVTTAQAANPIDEMTAAVGAYRLALDTVPGLLSPLDFRVLVELDRVQKERGVSGDLFEIGAYLGKSAILLGHLARDPAERLTVCDVFEHVELLDAEGFLQHNHWYADVSEKAFLDQYQRFHVQLPDVIVGSSEHIDPRALARTCRIVHVDGGHTYENVRQDLTTARELLGPFGIVAVHDTFTAHHPGAALAVWELVLSGTFVPVCITESKLYGTWESAAAADWVTLIDEWVSREPDLGSQLHTLVGSTVRRLFSLSRPPERAEHDVVHIPDLEGLPGADRAVSTVVADWIESESD